MQNLLTKRFCVWKLYMVLVSTLINQKKKFKVNYLLVICVNYMIYLPNFPIETKWLFSFFPHVLQLNWLGYIKK